MANCNLARRISIQLSHAVTGCFDISLPQSSDWRNCGLCVVLCAESGATLLITIIITSICMAHISKRTVVALNNKYKKLIKINLKMNKITVDNYRRKMFLNSF